MTITKKFQLSFLLLLSTAASNPLWAQQLEEVIVTATKRAVGLQDVPISLSVMQGEKISEQGINNLEQLAVFMPNVHVSEAASGDQLFIRGVGSGVNQGFEQSVGTFVDGIYFGRSQASRASFLDIERVEVLKGPQSTLFGKNTIAGAINITSAGPTQDFESYLAATYEPEFEHWSATAMVSGPLTDTLAARLVIKRDETEGYMDNQFLDQDQDEVQGKDTIGRVMFDWQANDTFNLKFKYESGESEREGRNNALTIANDFATGLYRAADPQFDPDFGYNRSASNPDGPRPVADVHNSEWDTATLTIEWQLGEHTLKATTGWIDSGFDNYIDADYSPLGFLARGRDESHEQLSQELLWSSPVGEKLEYLAGLYYQDEDLDTQRYTDVLPSEIGLGGGTLDGTVRGDFKQQSKTWSVFSQVTWHLFEDLRLIGGIRYSDDHKEFTKSSVTGDLFTGLSNPGTAGVYDAVLGLATDHWFDSSGAIRCEGVFYVCTAFPDVENERYEDHFTGDITLQWDVSDDLMAYAKIGNGYKAGGFDEDNARGRIDVEEFEDETVVGGEIGAKMDLLEGRGRINLALFYSEFEDVQLSTFDGNTGFIVRNAAETETQGIEFDGQFAATEYLTLTAALAYLDTQYSKFPDGPCNEPQALAWLEAGGTRETCAQDLGGKPLQLAPEWSGHLALDYRIPVGVSTELKMGLDAIYSDFYIVPADQDPLLNQDSYWKLNARVQLASIEDAWVIALLGRNLTNEKTTSFGDDVPLAAQGFSLTYFQFIDAPRSVEMQVRYNFR
ncbi:MAG: TonB-dependent receptor [Halioglobus sp.]